MTAHGGCALPGCTAPTTPTPPHDTMGTGICPPPPLPNRRGLASGGCARAAGVQPHRAPGAPRTRLGPSWPAASSAPAGVPRAWRLPCGVGSPSPGPPCGVGSPSPGPPLWRGLTFSGVPPLWRGSPSLGPPLWRGLTFSGSPPCGVGSPSPGPPLWRGLTFSGSPLVAVGLTFSGCPHLVAWAHLLRVPPLWRGLTFSGSPLCRGGSMAALRYAFFRSSCDTVLGTPSTSRSACCRPSSATAGGTFPRLRLWPRPLPTPEMRGPGNVVDEARTS